ncbi:MAG: metallophosphoesterase [Candidatus Pacearchaeota archaeon]
MKLYEFIDKTIFFPHYGILVVGDLHIGYEQELIESGISLPERQILDTISDFKKIIKEIENKRWKLKKIVFIGDIKHFFGYEQKENTNFSKILDFLKTKVSEKNIVLIKGNHDLAGFGLDLKNYYIYRNIAFVHGHKVYPEIFKKNINFIILGHLHPSVMLEDKNGVKKEIYKCFLEGKYKGKILIVLPSFLDFTEGTLINEYGEYYLESFSIIPKRYIINFNVYVVGENEVYQFGKVKNFI